MKYLIWNVDFTDNPNEGTTPESIIRDRGAEASGIFQIENFKILGIASDNADLSNLEKWEVQEITSDLALSYAREKNPNCFINDDGIITAPLQNPIGQ